MTLTTKDGHGPSRNSTGRRAPRTREQVAERLAALSEVDEASGCYLFTGGLDAQGYGRLLWSTGLRREGLAHRIAYILLRGELAEGLVIDHLCRNRACVNPDHMEAVSTAENIRRGFSSRGLLTMERTHCINGHEFTPENTYVVNRYRPSRKCRTCMANHKAKHKAATV